MWFSVAIQAALASELVLDLDKDRMEIYRCEKNNTEMSKRTYLK